MPTDFDAATARGYRNAALVCFLLFFVFGLGFLEDVSEAVPRRADFRGGLSLGLLLVVGLGTPCFAFLWIYVSRRLDWSIEQWRALQHRFRGKLFMGVYIASGIVLLGLSYLFLTGALYIAGAVIVPGSILFILAVAQLCGQVTEY